MSGRPYEYHPDKADRICVEIAKGFSLRAICEQEGMPAIGTIYVWLYREKEFQERYAHAREAQTEVFAQEMMEFADNCSTASKEEIAKAKLRIETRQWIASKLKPKKYGDAMTLKGDKDNPLDLGLAAALERMDNRRLPAIDKPKDVIDLQPLPANAEDYI